MLGIKLQWPKFIYPLAKVEERHMNRGCGNLLLKAAEEHSHRCLAAVTRVADLFPTHGYEDIQVLGHGHMKSHEVMVLVFFWIQPPPQKEHVAETIAEICKK
jgi:hypothetical protein